MRAFHVAGRTLASVRGDHVTLAFVLGAPALILFLFGEVLEAVPPGRFDASFVKPVLMAIFVFLLTYVLTGIGFLRERQNGTLERLLVGPTPRVSLVLGYLIGFGALALVQSLVILGAGVWFLGIEFEHTVWGFFALELLGALSALGFGILVSVVARTEFQILQVIPVMIAPQIILGGVFVPVDSLPVVLEWIARVLPLTYLIDGMAYLVLGQGSVADLQWAIGVLGAYSLGTVVLASLLVGMRR